MKNRTQKYINNQVKWLEKHMMGEFRAVRKAVDTYNESNNEWKESHNDLQRQMKEADGLFTKRAETDELKKQMPNFVTRKELWVAFVSIMSLLVAILVAVINYYAKSK